MPREKSLHRHEYYVFRKHIRNIIARVCDADDKIHRESLGGFKIQDLELMSAALECKQKSSKNIKAGVIYLHG